MKVSEGSESSEERGVGGEEIEREREIESTRERERERKEGEREERERVENARNREGEGERGGGKCPKTTQKVPSSPLVCWGGTGERAQEETKKDN